MSTPLTPQLIRNLGATGLMRRAAVDDTLIPDTSVEEAKNVHFDRIGAVTGRAGLTALGSTVLTARPATGLHNAQAGTAIVVFSNGSSSTIYSFNGSAWSVSLDGGTASVRIRFVDFGSYTIAINFMQNTYASMRFWNAGSSRHWHNTGNPINPQNMWGYSPQMGEVYKSRVYLFGDNTPGGSGAVASNSSRLFFSSVISSTGNITWAPGSDFVDINPGDGEDGSGLKRYGLELCCFKPNYIYRFRTSGIDPDPLVNVGTRSNESIIEGSRGLYFHHDSGFYRYSGGYPIKISKPIRDIVEAIPFSQFASIAAWKDTENVMWSIGNVTITEAKESITYKNAVLRYTESSDVWTLYSYASDIRRGITYTRGDTFSRLVATDYGIVATFDSGTTDLGQSIPFRMRTKWYEWEGIITQKVINEMGAYAEKAGGMDFSYLVDEDTKWQPIGQLKKLTNFYKNKSMTFHRIRFQIAGMSKNEPPVFLGFDVLKGLNEGIVE